MADVEVWIHVPCKHRCLCMHLNQPATWWIHQNPPFDFDAGGRVTMHVCDETCNCFIERDEEVEA